MTLCYNIYIYIMIIYIYLWISKYIIILHITLNSLRKKTKCSVHHDSLIAKIQTIAFLKLNANVSQWSIEIKLISLKLWDYMYISIWQW